MTSSMSGARIEVRSVRRHFPETGPVVDTLNFKVEPGEFVSLLGPSGCGKSTLLRLIAGLDEPDAGEIKVDSFGREFFRSFVFQEAHLLPWRSVLENAALPLELMGVSKNDRLGQAREILSRVGLAEALGRYPSQLSGGMKMRVSLARALVTKPTLLLLDEPFAALDETTRFRLQEDLRSLWETLRMTVVFVTHSASEAVFLSERAVVFSPRPARVLLDRKIHLPELRVPNLRTDASLIAEVKTLSDTLRGGESLR